MNEVSIKLSCPCGASLELSAPAKETAWLTKRADEWQKRHVGHVGAQENIQHSTFNAQPQNGEIAGTVFWCNGCSVVRVAAVGELCLACQRWQPRLTHYSCWICKRSMPWPPSHTSNAMSGPFHYCPDCNPLKPSGGTPGGDPRDADATRPDARTDRTEKADSRGQA